MRALAAVAAVAVLAACWFGWSWWSAAHDDRLAVAGERDAVVADISRAVVTLHTIDYRTAAEDVDGWIQATSGQLGEDLRKDRQLQLDRAAGTKSVATARLREIAVTRLDPQKGVATLLAVLDVRLATQGGPASPQRSRLTVEAGRTGDGWRITGVQAAGA